MFWFFGRKGEVEKVKEEVRESFDHVKKDFSKVSQWISHLDGKHKKHDEDISEIKTSISTIKDELADIKGIISFLEPRLSKQAQTAVYKQTAVQAVQTPVQTAVQTAILENLTVMERAIVWALINSDSDMKLSYEDLAALLGKDKSTIRGQINALKQKSESLIQEVRESNGKKRLFVPEKMRDLILKSVKVKVKKDKKT